MALCLSMTPLGLPVDPDVYMISPTCSGVGSLYASDSSEITSKALPTTALPTTASMESTRTFPIAEGFSGTPSSQ